MPLLVLLSGFCGISYEILYTRLLGNMLGNQFTINAAVLLTFLLSIGFGTLYAHRLRKWLWAIELSIGGYAIFMALGHNWIDRLVYQTLPFISTDIFASALVCFILLIVPAFLVGCSIPLFAAYLGALGKKSTFAGTYAIYNIGAASTALMMEFYLIRELGLEATTLVLAGLNAVVAVGILIIVSRIKSILVIPPKFFRFDRRILLALGVASVASAIFQLLMMKVTEFILGPFNETFALVLATVLIGLAIGSMATRLLRLNFSGALLITLVGLAWLLAIHPTVLVWYSSLYEDASKTYLLLVLLKFGTVFLLMGLPAIGFGATVPSLLRNYNDVAHESGQLLFWSATANALGFCLMAFVLHRYLDYGVMLLLIVTMVFVAIAIDQHFHGSILVGAGVLLSISIIAFLFIWNELLLYIGHTNLHTAEEYQTELEQRIYADRFKGPQDVFAITWRGDEPYFFINGYISVPLESATEKKVGVISSMLAPRHDRALVLGMGTGATASAVSLAFDSTDVVEINKVVLDNLYRMSEYNFDIEHLPGVNIIHDDGIRFLKSTDKKYSLILNTVTSPLYFSSSKLYTQDFYESVRQRLTDDGVYITWIDWHIGEKGLDIVLETLSQSFEECWLNYMTKNYFLLGCSNLPLAVRQFTHVANQPDLKADFAKRYGLPIRLLPYSVIHTDLFKLKSDTQAPVNTLDHPVLEFEMAKVVGYTNLLNFRRRLQQHQNLSELKRRTEGQFDWDVSDYVYYADMVLDSERSLNKIILENSERQTDFNVNRYQASGLAIATELGYADGSFEQGERLYLRGYYSSAIQAMKQAIERNPAFGSAWYFIGKSHLKRREFSLALDAFLAAWEFDQELYVARRIISTLFRLGKLAEAGEWVDRALKLEGAKKDKQLAAYHRIVIKHRSRQR